MKSKSPAKQLDAFIARYTPEIAALARSAFAKLQERLPGAVMMVYDNYNALVIGFAPGERPSEAILSLVLYPRWVNLCFLKGVGLPDPDGLLQGSGKQVRHVRLESAETLDEPGIQTLIATALDHSEPPFDPANPGLIVIKAVSEAQRPRRPEK
jgi:hypothetical protein